MLSQAACEDPWGGQGVARADAGCDAARAGPADRTCGFTLDLQPGRYDLTVEAISKKDRRVQMISAFTVR